MTLSPQTEYGASFSLPNSPLLRPFAPLTPQGVDRPLFACFTATMTASDFFRSQQFPITFKLSGPAPNLGVRHGSVVAGARWGHSNTIQAAAWLVKLR